ncbi:MULTISPECIES: flagellar hook-length control protein FliK [Reinekea]|uniref:Flagellar hook-length control protein FliK n=1 Tax=Reinekea forsetii TaxID=1336806 RepID=A0A2K8KPH0_9GAMM|nr:MULTISPECIES: flagellar hook-length control protein FliK [Reinekea]ATX76670.1 flagellar hook-length control protein FliK [Reinekea forsetii]
MLSYLMQAIEVKNQNTPATARNVAAKRLEDHERADERRFDQLLSKTESVARVADRQTKLAADDAQLREDSGEDLPQSDLSDPVEEMDSEGFLNYLMANAGLLAPSSSEAARAGPPSPSLTPSSSPSAETTDVQAGSTEGDDANLLGADTKPNTPAVTVANAQRVNTMALSAATDSPAAPVLRPLSGLGSINEPSARPALAATPNPLAAKTDELLNRPMKLDYAGSELFDKIQMMTRGGLQQAVIRLDPPELGALEVRILVQQDQTQVQIVSSSSVVRDLLEQQSTRLRESLAEQGMALANLDVQDSSSQGQGGATRDGGSGVNNAPAEPGFDGVSEPAAEVIQNLSLVDQYV